MDKDTREKLDKLKSIIKYYASKRGYNLTTLLKKNNELNGTNPDVSNFSAKFRRGTFTISELYQIAKIIGVDIVFKDDTDEIIN